ncbi:DUF7845 domain-containing protein [Natronolimnobius baerhuensis]
MDFSRNWATCSRTTAQVGASSFSKTAMKTVAICPYYHTATPDPRRVREAFSSHELLKEVEHYYAQHAVSLDNNRSIARPNVGTSYQCSFWNDQLDASPADIERLNRELEETLLSVLAEVGLSLRSRTGT